MPSAAQDIPGHKGHNQGTEQTHDGDNRVFAGRGDQAADEHVYRITEHAQSGERNQQVN